MTLLPGVAVGGYPTHAEQVTEVDEYGRTSLHYAAADGDSASVERLLRSGEDARAVDRGGWTPLHFAAQSNSDAAVRELLEAGAPVDPRDGHGNTPLFRAVFNSRGSGEVIALLRAAGADPNSSNSAGQTPLGLARLIGNYDVARFFADLP